MPPHSHSDQMDLGELRNVDRGPKACRSKLPVSCQGSTRRDGEATEAKQRRVLTDHNVLSHISLDRNPHISRVGQPATSKPVWEWVLISMIERLSESDLRKHTHTQSYHYPS